MLPIETENSVATKNYKRGLFRAWLAFTLIWVPYFAWSGITGYNSEKSARSSAMRNFERSLAHRIQAEKETSIADRRIRMQLADESSKYGDEALERSYAWQEQFERAYTYGLGVPLALLAAYFIGMYVMRGFNAAPPTPGSQTATNPLTGNGEIQTVCDPVPSDPASDATGLPKRVTIVDLLKRTPYWVGVALLMGIVGGTLVYMHSPEAFAETILATLIKIGLLGFVVLGVRAFRKDK